VGGIAALANVSKEIDGKHATWLWLPLNKFTMISQHPQTYSPSTGRRGQAPLNGGST
jgi:hypothetical protein